MVKLDKNVKKIIWKPSGGLGHCLSNLAWVINLCQNNNCEFYIYRFDNHLPFGYHASDIIDFYKTSIKINEIKTNKNFLEFIDTNKISKKSENLIYNAKYNTGLKSLNDDNSIVLVCNTGRYRISNLFKFKEVFIDSILANPYYYYKNDFTLLEDTKNTKKYLYTFEIKGSYYKFLNISNNKLGITYDNNDYKNIKKTLTIEYTLTNGIKGTLVCKEKTEHFLKYIKSIDRATYGVKDKTLDVTTIIQNKLKKHIILNYNYSLNIPSLDISNNSNVTVKYVNIEGKAIKKEFLNNENINIKGITELTSVICGPNDNRKNITNMIKKKYLEKNKITKNLDIFDKELEEEKKIINSIIRSKDYIAVHFRYRDKKVQGGKEKKIKEIKQKIKETGIKNVFIATDSCFFFDYVAEEIKDIKIFRFTNPPEKGRNIHYSKEFEKGENLYKTLLDIYTCKNASFFIESKGSGFSNMIKNSSI